MLAENHPPLVVGGGRWGKGKMILSKWIGAVFVGEGAAVRCVSEQLSTCPRLAMGNLGMEGLFTWRAFRSKIFCQQCCAGVG